MRYAEARLDEYQREEAYRFYVTKSLQLIPQDKHIILSFEEILHPEKQDNRSGEDIALDVMERAGLKFGDNAYGNDSI